MRYWHAAIVGLTLTTGPALANEAATAPELDVIVVCSERSYINGEPFAADTPEETRARWPEAAQSLNPDNFSNPAFRSIPSPEGFIVIEQGPSGLLGKLHVRKNRVRTVAEIRNGNEQLVWERLSATLGDSEPLGLFTANGYYLRPATNLTASPLVRPTLNETLQEGEQLRFQDADSRDHLIFDTAQLVDAWQSARELCRTTDENAESVQN